MSTKRDSEGTDPQQSAGLTTEPGVSASAAAGLDELDADILSYLARNGRATNYEVGEAVGLSASAASRRILALEQSALVLSAFEAAVRHCHDIVSCHLLAGQYDYILVARVAGIEDYNRLHQNELSRLPGVIRLETSFALRDVLETERR